MRPALDALQRHCARAARHKVAVLTLGLMAGLATDAQAAEPPASAGRALATRHGCLGCHAAQSQLVGPAYEAVAQRYRDNKGAAAEIALHIRAGSSGRWGTVAMPPQAQVAPADARRLAAWILAGAK